MALLDKAAKAASKPLDVAGKSVTLRRKSYGVDPDSGSPVGTTTTDYTVTMLLSEYPEALIDGETIRPGDVRGLLRDASLSVDPTPETDAVVVGGATLELVGTKRIWSGADVALWELHLR